MPSTGPAANPADPVARIAERARELMCERGCRALTMDDLARDLGISKKTLYARVPSKEALVEQVLRGFVAQTEHELAAVLDEPGRDFLARKERLFAVVFRRLGQLPPRVFQDIEREFPRLRPRVEAMRAKVLPRMLGRLLQIGAAEGRVRPDVDAAFFGTVFLAGANALLRAEMLDRFQLHPAEMAARLARLLFDGVAARPAPQRKPNTKR